MSVAERENREAHSCEIALVGLGAMGLPMALNLLAAGHRVTSRSGDAGRTARFAQAGGVVGASWAEVEYRKLAILERLKMISKPEIMLIKKY